MQLSAGAKFGIYTLNQCLGQGGMAEVWSATHSVLGVQVALKVLYEGEPALQSRFLREGRVQFAMNHPNVLPVRDVVDHSGVPGLVLPLIAGPSLDKLLQKYRPTEAEAVAVFEALVQGVAHAHSQGLIHRDLKPGNVLLDERAGRLCPRIADFGLVKELGAPQQTQTGAVMGTLSYAAPEQLLDASKADHRADLFSLGVILVELLTGRLPFRGSTLDEVLRAHQQAPALDGLSDAWRALCVGLLKPDPQHRTEDCRRLQQQLVGFAGAGGLDPLLGNGALAQAAHAQKTSFSKSSETMGASQFASATWSGLSHDDAVADGAAPLAGALEPLQQPLPKHNLPAELDAFIGREAALSELQEAVQGSRLVSVLGAGGIGKTRFTLRFAREQLSSYPGGVFFCDLSEARTLEGIISIVAQAMDVPLGKGDHLTQLGHAIAGHDRCLLLFDNFEQVANHAADTVERWLRRAEEARFMVTSRVLLEVAGERALRLPPLDEAEAVDLFVERASKKKPDFSLTEDNREAITALVGLLDGLPLAVELATARVRVMKPAEILRRMNQRFKLLAAGGRSASGRQATLRAAIDWSWDLLADWEKAAFAQCAVFEGGFTLEAAEAVINLDAFEDAPWPMDAVQSLVDKSLLRPTGENRMGELRFGMLVSLHEYAIEKLELMEAASSELARHRHMVFYAQFGEEQELEALDGFDGVNRWWRLFAELDNLLAAHQHATRHKSADEAAWLAMALSAIAYKRQPTIALEPLNTSLGVVGERSLLRARIHHALGAMHHVLGQVGLAKHHWQIALKICREVGCRRREGIVLSDLGVLCRQSGQTAMAEQHYQSALVIHQEVENRGHEGVVLGCLGVLYLNRGEMTLAEEFCQNALHIHREVGNRSREGIVQGHLGIVYLRQGQVVLTEELYQSALLIHQEVGNRRYEGIVLGNLGVAYHDQGEVMRAEEYFQRSLRIHREVGNRLGEGSMLCEVGNLYLEQGRVAHAKESYQAALHILREVGNRSREGIVLSGFGQLHLSQGQAARAEEYFQRALHIHREVGNRVGEGVALFLLGRLYFCQGLMEKAENQLGEALHIATVIRQRNMEGRCLSLLGVVVAVQGQVEAGLSCLRRGETVLRGVRSRTQLGYSLSNRAHVEHLAHNPDAANAALNEARQIAADLQLQEEAPFVKNISRVQAILNAPPPPTP